MAQDGHLSVNYHHSILHTYYFPASTFSFSLLHITIEVLSTLTCSLIHTHTHRHTCTLNFACIFLITSWISYDWHCNYSEHIEGHNSLVQVIYIVQPSSLTQRLMCVCLSFFHVIPIKTLLQSNWTQSASGGCQRQSTALTSGETRMGITTRRLSCHKMPYHRKEFHTVYIKVFFDSTFGFIIFLYPVFDSLKRRLRLNSHCPPLTRRAALSLLFTAFWPHAVII